MSEARARPLRADRFAVQSLGERAEALRTQWLRARDSLDPDSVHDLRVAIRRLRACLAAFPNVFCRRTERMEQSLRKLFRLAGTVRDADIALELRNASSRSARRLAKQRRRKARKLRQLLRKSRLQKLLKRIRWVVRHPCRDRRDVTDVGADALGRRTEALLKQGRALVKREAEAAELHRLRITVKKLRYGAEVFRPVLGPRLAGVLEDLESLQTLLGEIQDCATALRLLPSDDAEARPQLLSRQAELRQQFYRHWRECVDAPREIERRRPRSATASAAAT